MCAVVVVTVAVVNGGGRAFFSLSLVCVCVCVPCVCVGADNGAARFFLLSLYLAHVPPALFCILCAVRRGFGNQEQLHTMHCQRARIGSR